MRGCSLKDLQELMRHKNINMTLRYAHLSQEHRKKSINILNGLTGLGKSAMSQNVTFGLKSKNLKVANQSQDIEITQ
jgi:hypothetical protein